MAQRDNVWLAGVKAVGGAVLAVVAIWAAAVSTLDIPPEFLPLAGPGPSIFFSTVLGTMAVVVFAVVRRFSSRPIVVYRRIAAAVLVVSFVPDLLMLGEGAAETFPGATPAGVAVLMTMHVTVATVIVWVLTGGRGPEEVSS